MHPGTLRLCIPSELDHVFLVGLAVKGICAQVLSTNEEIYQAELCVVEAVNNAIEHAYWGAAGHFVEVVVRVDERALTFEVGDTGEPMNWREVLAAIEDATDVRREGNRGLSIILSCMDSVSYHSEPGKNVLAFAKHLPPGTPESLDRLT